MVCCIEHLMLDLLSKNLSRCSPLHQYTTSVTSGWVIERVPPQVPSLCLYQGMCDGRIDEILKVLLPPPDNVPSRGQQLSTRIVNSVRKALLPPPEAQDGLPELLQGQLVVAT
ncbi:hypothetical protein GOODEAATRI_016482 [Goodea atripinnis]|uniref:Uncharacterized protein n=1 Tax=Goodea atripinnis TaxID=208336 RepID=A0ABV0PP76_9TELE